jgi:hypothetical protein
MSTKNHNKATKFLTKHLRIFLKFRNSFHTEYRHKSSKISLAKIVNNDFEEVKIHGKDRDLVNDEIVINDDDIGALQEVVHGLD